MEKQTFALGSGELYILEYENDVNQGIPEDSVIENPLNKVGSIKGGAELVYSPEAYSVVDDAGFVLDTFITKEEASLKSGILTWNMETLKKLSASAEIDDSDPKHIVLKVGGRGQSGMATVLVRFIHTFKKTKKKLRVTIVGTPSNGFTLTFNPEEETVIDAEFTAIPHDSEGTLIHVKKEKDTNAPTISGEVATGSVTLNWDAPSGATKQALMYKTPGGNWTELSATGSIKLSAALNASSATATVTGLTDGQPYSFKLIVTGGVNAGDSNTLTLTPHA